jgi:hypothetical protein
LPVSAGVEITLMIALVSSGAVIALLSLWLGGRRFDRLDY